MENKFEKYISSTVSYHDFKEAINIANELGVGIEISRFGRLADVDENFEKNKKEYKAILADFDYGVTLHGFFSNLNIAAKDPKIAQISKDRYYQSLELAAEFGAKNVCFHTCLNNLLKQKQYQEMFFLKNIEFYKEFSYEFEAENIMLTMENVHEKDWTFIRNLVAAVNSSHFGATIDIGHCNLHSDIPVSEWIREYGIMLKHMHFHNNFTDEDSHSSLLEGSVEIKPILQTLKDMHLYPKIVFEIFDKGALVESVNYFNQIVEEI